MKEEGGKKKKKENKGKVEGEGRQRKGSGRKGRKEEQKAMENKTTNTHYKAEGYEMNTVVSWAEWHLTVIPGSGSRGKRITPDQHGRCSNTVSI